MNDTTWISPSLYQKTQALLERLDGAQFQCSLGGRLTPPAEAVMTVLNLLVDRIEILEIQAKRHV